MKPVYTCDNYEFKDSVFTIYEPTLAAMVLDIEGFNSLTKMIQYNAIVCPELFIEESGAAVKLVIFKK